MGERSIAVDFKGIKEHTTRQSCCPGCKSKNIRQVDPPEYGQRSVECNVCEHFWIEKLS